MPKLGKYDEENVRWEGGKILTPTSPPKLVRGYPIFWKGVFRPLLVCQISHPNAKSWGTGNFQIFSKLVQGAKTAPTFEETVNNIDAEIVPRDTGIANIWYTGG